MGIRIIWNSRVLYRGYEQLVIFKSGISVRTRTIGNSKRGM